MPPNVKAIATQNDFKMMQTLTIFPPPLPVSSKPVLQRRHRNRLGGGGGVDFV